MAALKKHIFNSLFILPLTFWSMSCSSLPETDTVTKIAGNETNAIKNPVPMPTIAPCFNHGINLPDDEGVIFCMDNTGFYYPYPNGADYNKAFTAQTLNQGNRRYYARTTDLEVYVDDYIGTNFMGPPIFVFANFENTPNKMSMISKIFNLEMNSDWVDLYALLHQQYQPGGDFSHHIQFLTSGNSTQDVGIGPSIIKENAYLLFVGKREYVPLGSEKCTEDEIQDTNNQIDSLQVQIDVLSMDIATLKTFEGQPGYGFTTTLIAEKEKQKKTLEEKIQELQDWLAANCP